MTGPTNIRVNLVQYAKIGRKSTSIEVAFYVSGAPVIHQAHLRFDTQMMGVIKG